MFFIFLIELAKTNPVLDFIKQYHSPNSEKLVLITFNVQNCGSCNYPIQTIIREIKQYNNSIPIYLVTSESLNQTAKKFYLNQIGVSYETVHFICDEKLYHFMIDKTKKTDNISVITLKGKIVSIKRIDKNIDLTDILYEFKDNIYMDIHEILSIKNTITDYSKSYSAIIFNQNTFVIFKRGINILSIYNYKGDYKNLHLDTLPICNINFFKTLITSDEYNNSKYYYKIRKVNEILTPISIFKITENEFGITYYLKTFKDSVYKRDSVIYENQKPLVVVLDTNFHIKKILKFHHTVSSKIILESQSAHSDSTFYFLYSNGINKYAIGQFKLNNNSELILDTLKSFHFSINENTYLPIIQNTSIDIDNSALFTIYDQLDKNSSTIFKMNKDSNTIPLCHLKKTYVYGAMVYQTESGNLLYGAYVHSKFQIKKLVLSNKVPTITKKEYPKHIYFVYEGKLFRISYSER